MYLFCSAFLTAADSQYLAEQETLEKISDVKSNKNIKAIVVGAGIAGLAAAFRLRQAGCEVKVLEAEDHVGGRMWTIEHEGFLLDTGAMVISAGYKELLKLVSDAGLSHELVPASGDIGFLREGVVNRIRTTPSLDVFRGNLFSKTDLLAMGRIAVDLALAWRNLEDPVKAQPLDQDSLESYARRRGLSQGAIEYFIEPLSMSLWFEPSANMSRLAFFWALRRVFGGGFLNSTKGMGFLPAGLAAQLDVSTGAKVKEVIERDSGVEVAWEGGSELADAAVIALPLPEMAAVYPQLSAAGKKLVDQLRYSNSVHVHFGLSSAPDETCSMVYSCPQKFDGLGVSFFEHNKVPGRAPQGKGLITSYFLQDWCDRHRDLGDDQVTRVAGEQVARAFPRMLDDLETSYVSRRSSCVVINQVGLSATQLEFEADCTANSRIQLAGDYFTCSATNTSLVMGERAAENLLNRWA